jgi:hypothetical protein
MIDHELRKSLSQNARRLITGRTTNDAFDDVYYRSYASSDDRAVSEIAQYCYGLYSSDVLFPYRLRGWHAVDDETRSTCARGVLFLRSGLEYEWPSMPDDPGWRFLAGMAMFLGVPAGIVLSLVCVPLAIIDFEEPIVWLAVTGVMLLVGSFVLAFRYPQFLRDDWKRFTEFGDIEVWPFLRKADFDQARTSCHLFAK